MVNTVDTEAAFTDPMGLGLVVTFGVGHGFGIADGFAVVPAEVPWGGGKGVMNGFVGEVEEEGTGFIPAFVQPLDGQVGEDVGGIAVEPFASSVDVEDGVKIDTLAAETGPVIESGARIVFFVSHMPFADEGGGVAGFLEVLWEEMGAGRNGTLIVDDMVAMHVLAGEDRGAARRAKGGGDKGVLEVGPFSCHAVQVRSLEEGRGLGQEAHKVIAMIVAEDEDDVSASGRVGVEGKGD